MQLVEQHRKGDPTALAELLQTYQRRVYAVCYRMLRHPEEAADLTQDALVKVLEGLDSYDGRSKLSTWIIRITINCCLSHLRKQKLRKHASIDVAMAGEHEEGGRSPAHADLWLGREHSAHDRVEQEELRSILRNAMMTLDPEARAILVLRDMQNLEYEQVSEVLDIPLGTVKSRLFRARAALRAAVEAATGDLRQGKPPSEPPRPRSG